MRELSGNPLLVQHRRRDGRLGTPEGDDPRFEFAFAVPDDAALSAVSRHSPNGVVELGAGTGYWARLLHELGIDVKAFDIDPPPSSTNPWFAGKNPWFPVARGDQRSVGTDPARTLLLVWPTRNEAWASDAAERYLVAGGQRLIYVGESPGGCTGDARFHARLGLLTRCLACAYDIGTVPCVCDITARWELLERVEVPRWIGFEDSLFVFRAPAPIEGTALRTPHGPRWRDRMARLRSSNARDAPTDDKGHLP